MALRVKVVWLLAAAIVLLAGPPARAGNLTVAWDPNPAEEDVASYLVCYGATSRHEDSAGFPGYDHEVDVGLTNSYDRLPDGAPDGGNLYVSVVAKNRLGLRSDYSTELTVFADGGTTGGAASGGGSGGCFLRAVGAP